ncbi:hypothetical protein VHEMI06737 [[Torrubiella] hemipterigena]|uniref:Peptidase S59 domain-containing protein n=1 Tax=[Torrubiella] hemipterigena TaxID=1531966 RepID=A0A0A1T870_9HYPO|nr:hypothetical protein VHEMI06737 [[Torrubiella] hemipterigena]
MSFGGGGFGGFGQNNNQSSGFGGFGSNNNNNSTGFGSSASGGFGQNKPTGGTMFGANNNTGGGFGSTTGGFGSNTSGGFGTNNANTSFGASTSGGGLFGGNNNTTTNTSGGFGGFGSNNTTTASTGFGSTAANNSGGLFGAKPGGFGSSTSGSLFGGGNTATGGFGSNASTGFGANNNAVNDPPGTAVTPFQAYTEKEPNSTNTQNAFQNILFQDPYKKWSADELRLVDYAQGRRHGNASGAGAFGVGSGFGGGFGSSTTTPATGGFGSNTNTPASGGLFGSNNNTSTTTGFGQSASTGFGASTTNSGGLFGQNKPATTGGLFGSNTNTTTQSGGLFGSASGGFGSNTNTTATTGGFGTSASGGLFGNNNQAKPAGTGFSFGNTATNTATTTGGFGTSASTGFGAANTTNTGGGLFGNNTTTTPATGGGLFGNTQTQQNTTSAFGGGFGQQNQTQQTGGGLFGAAAAKPATGGLFGASTTTPAAGGGLFGNTATQPAAGGAFGAQNTASGGLFGAAKPATGGLFGNAGAAQPAATGGTGLFGAANAAQPATGGGLFGSTAQAQKPGGLFGASTQATGGGLFGQSTQNQGSSLFGGSTQAGQQGGALGNSLLGNSQQSQNAPQGLTANLNDVSAYGTPALFAGLGGNEVADPGPLATPLNGGSKPRKSAILPLYKLAPASASRYATPQKRGFGFSYSSYGTPGGSPASISSTPNGGLGRSLLGSGSSGSLSKSMSTNNLRRAFNAEDSILAPGAFSSSNGARWYGSTGSKKLVINREIRSDLFSTPQKDKQIEGGSARKLAKRVSFDTSNGEADETTPIRGALPAPEDVASAKGDETPRQNKTTAPANVTSPEMEQVKGNELAIVHEEDNAATPEGHQGNGFENAPGQYWMQPTREELQAMNRIQRQKVDGFTVGRDNVGYVKFKIPVDISGIDMDELCGGIIQLEPRSATVYPVAAKKPPVGKGLNVPATIALEQSWPRGGRDKRVSSDPKRFNKHVDRLKRIPDTTFESYDKDTGVWIFGVEHFTTYGLDDSDDETDADEVTEPTLPTREEIPEAMDQTPTARFRGSDTRQHRVLPGAFDEPEDFFDGDVNSFKQSFLGVSSADSAFNDVHLSLEGDEMDMGGEYELSEDEDLARPSTGQHHAAELDENSPEDTQVAKRGTPGGILRARMRAVKDSAGPVTLEVADGDDWAEMLRKTVSPVKRDRQLLRELNDSPSKMLIDFGESPVKAGWGKKAAKDGKQDGFSANLAGDKNRGFATSIDLMNSLFEKPKPARENLRASTTGKGFPKWPYQRQNKSMGVEDDEKAFHNVPRPTWGPNETLVAARPLGSRQFRHSLRDNTDILVFQRSGIQTDGQDLRLAKFATQLSKVYLRSQDKLTKISLLDNVPFAALQTKSIKEMFHHQDMNDPASIHEKRVWELASVLFDQITPRSDPEHVNRKGQLSEFWTELVEQASSTAVGLAGSSEEKAVACLAGHRITEACKHLLDGKNYRLGTLVPLLGTSDSAKKDMKDQLKQWQDSKMLSEFSEAIRTICELLSGNVCACEGMKNVPIEDRLESFVISKKFGLDWRQSFGLRLWYALNQDDDAREAVLKFKDDITQDREDIPCPWYVEQNIQPLWKDAELDSREDLLWGLLQLYADRNTNLDAILQPENSQLSPMDIRVCWQLGQALLATGKATYGDDSDAKADAVTIAYAAQLTTAGEWLEAVFVLLHLRDATARKQAIQEHLCRHAGLIGPESDSSFSILTEKFLIPAEWVWEALALYMRSVKKDASSEVQCLLKAGSFSEAHRVLVNQVAPEAIVERNYSSLSSLLEQFEGREDSIAEWSLGGEIYGHFLGLIQHRSKDESVPSALLERHYKNCVWKLL